MESFPFVPNRLEKEIQSKEMKIYMVGNTGKDFIFIRKMRCLYHELRLKSPETNLKSEILILCQILGNTSGNGNLIKTNSIKLIIKIVELNLLRCLCLIFFKFSKF